MNTFPQSLHSKRFSPVWINMCLAKLVLLQTTCNMPLQKQINMM